MLERASLLCAAIAVFGCGLVERDPEPDAIVPPPDGAWLAYKTRVDGASGPSGLYVTQPGLPDTTETIVEGADAVFDVAWSPSDALLAVSTNPTEHEGQLEVVELGAEGVMARRVLDVTPSHFSRLRWSPDGRYLAYAITGGKAPRELRLIDVASGAAPITLGAADEAAEMAWSPASTAIAFSADDGDGALYIARADEGFVPRLVVLPDGVHRPSVAEWHDDSTPEGLTGWSPSGRWLAFMARAQQDVDDFGWLRVFVADEHASSVTLVSPAQNSVHPLAGGVQWSPDETLITYEDTTPSTDAPLIHARYAVAFDDGVVGEPVEIGADEAEIRWVQDRRLLSVEKVAFDQMRATFVDLALFPAVSVSQLFSLERSCHQVEMHAESQHVVLACSKQGDHDRGLWIWDPSRPAPIEVFTAPSLSLTDHGWSPSGESFAFHAKSAVQPGALELHQAGVGAGGVETVDDDARHWQKATTGWVQPWNEDGSAYFFTREDGTLKVRLTGAAALLTIAGGSGLEAFGAAWQRTGYDAD